MAKKNKKENKVLKKLIWIILTVIVISILITIALFIYSSKINTTDLQTKNTYTSESGFSVNYPAMMQQYPVGSSNSQQVIIGYPDSDVTIRFTSYPNPENLSETDWWELNGANILKEQNTRSSMNLKFNNFKLSKVQFGKNEFLYAENTEGINSQYIINIGKNTINIIPGMINKELIEKILSSFRFTN